MQSLHNRLADASSLYLRQHATNPVYWQPWDEHILEYAGNHGKLLLISIGYAACHWCHVMEHECFADTEVAAVMNKDFVPIKIDRESRPDLDALYMDALQLMTGRGGWPLNIIALPDGRPIYGGTFFPKKQWLAVLKQISSLWENEPHRVYAYAEHMQGALLQHQHSAVVDSTHLPDASFYDHAFLPLSASFDPHFGGLSPAPKFPMPVVWRFWLKYGVLSKRQEVIDQGLFTLERIAAGGIYDQLGGGFARYSVDPYWKVPHFEKMLYDNAQLVTLYAEAYRLTKNPRFKEVVVETLAWCKAELRQSDGAYAAALDADSEGLEGKYYVWTAAEMANNLTDKEMALAESWFGLKEEAYWEDDLLVLQQLKKPDELAILFQYSRSEVETLQEQIRLKLLDIRQKRQSPACDTKQLLGWNAMLLEALAEAYVSLADVNYLQDATELARALEGFNREGQWYRVKYEGNWSQPAFSEDLVYLAQAFFRLYQVSSNSKWLVESEKLVEQLRHFVDQETGLLCFGQEKTLHWHIDKIELADNVQPSANSVYAHLLYQLAAIHGDSVRRNQALTLFRHALPKLDKHLRFYAGWGSLGLDIAYDSAIVTLTGVEAEVAFIELSGKYLPGEYFIWAKDKPNYPSLVANRYTTESLRIDRCIFGQCELPVTSVAAYVHSLH